MSIDLIRATLGRYRLPVSDEAGYQFAVATALGKDGITFEREYDLGVGYGRVDFFVPSLGLAMELKVKGSPSDVVTQLHRYARCPQVQALMLVTGRARLGTLPTTLNGKPLTIVSTWRGCL